MTSNETPDTQPDQPGGDRSKDMHHATAVKRIKESATIEALRAFLSPDEDRDVVKKAVEDRIREIKAEDARKLDAAGAKRNLSDPVRMIEETVQAVEKEGWAGFSDYNEGEEFDGTELPRELPKSIVLDGEPIPVMYLRMDPESAIKHELANWMKPVMFDTGYVKFRDLGVPRHYFNGAGEMRFGDLMTFVIDERVYRKWEEARQRPHNMKMRAMMVGRESQEPDQGGFNQNPLDMRQGPLVDS
jgi:hypothetical protein